MKRRYGTIIAKWKTHDDEMLSDLELSTIINNLIISEDRLANLNIEEVVLYGQDSGEED